MQFAVHANLPADYYSSAPMHITGTNHVIHLSRWWNPAVEDQCSDRVYRIGQNKTVHVYYPMAVLPRSEEHSFDMQLQVLMNCKRELAKNLLVSSAFTKSDYEDLIRGVGATGQADNTQ
jgi:SNF2 family DNA or RNA helicase